jgi:hypothetical protein
MLNDQAHSTSRVHSANVWRSMQFSATLLAFLLCCVLGCSEISELAGLQDDTSNDCVYTLETLPECARVAPRSPNRDTPAARPQLLPVKGLRAQKVSRPEFVGSGSSHSVSELLHFLSIQRT